MSFSEKTKSAFLWLGAVALISSISAYATWRTVALEKKISDANQTIAMMKLEHEAAAIAVSESYQSRKEIYERAKERLCEAEKAIGGNADICDIVIPDDLRLLWEKPAHGHDNLRSPR